jgi:hypothetical protein
MVRTGALPESGTAEAVDTEVEPLADAFVHVAGKDAVEDLHEKDYEHAGEGNMVVAAPWEAEVEHMLDIEPGRVDLHKVAACSQPKDRLWNRILLALQVDRALLLVADGT